MAFTKKTVRDVEVDGKRVLCRVDFNVPLKDGVVGDTTRIVAALPTIKYLVEHNARVILMSHLGRPKGDGPQPELSLAPVAAKLAELSGFDVAFVDDTYGQKAADAVAALEPGKILVLENVRFDKREKKNDPEIGKTLASELGVTTGDTITLNKTTASGKKNEQKIKLTGVYDSGDEDNGSLYIASSTAQVLADLPDSVDKIEVKALTTPENDLARKAAANPAALSQEEWETWYCTAYPSSIAYQIEEVIPGAVAKQVRQVAALQGNVLQKTQAVMILMTVLSLIAAAVAVANLMVASIGERSGELALLKALGATDAAVSRLMLAETAAISLLGAIVGALLGSGVAQLIGRVVFGSGITMRPMVFVLVFVLLAVTVLLASASSIRSILNLKPAEVLHGR